MSGGPSCSYTNVLMNVANEEEFDEAFLLELDAAEAAAVANRVSGTNTAPLSPQRDATGAPPDRTLEQGCSTRTRSTQRALHHGTARGMNLSWRVDSISVRDDDAAAEGSAEERIGEVRTPTGGSVSVVYNHECPWSIGLSPGL